MYAWSSKDNKHAVINHNGILEHLRYGESSKISCDNLHLAMIQDLENKDELLFKIQSEIQRNLNETDNETGCRFQGLLNTIFKYKEELKCQ